ncbi:MAG: PASTA domain-containing protein, partial [Firmicutes bacterium]|nr:PASTA domain-containing protein [Bacillota bacterium]
GAERSRTVGSLRRDLQRVQAALPHEEGFDAYHIDKSLLTSIDNVPAVETDAAIRAVRTPEGEADMPLEAKRRIPGWILWSGSALAVVVGGFLALDLWINQPTVSVPNLKGASTTAAQERLSKLGLHLVVSGSAPSSKIAKGRIVAENPSIGSAVKSGQNVAVVVSSGPEKVIVPSVVGEDIDQARTMVRTQNLSVHVHYVSSSEPAGEVLRQSPAAGQSLMEGRTVDVWVSHGRHMTPPSTSTVMANVAGMTLDQASQVLTTGDFTVASPQSVYSTEPVNTVVSQTPAPYTPVSAGETVHLTVSQGLSPTSAGLPRNVTVATWQIPDTAPAHSRFQVVATDEAGNTETFYEQVNPGQTIELPITWYGYTGQLQTYLNGQQNPPQTLSVSSAASPSAAPGTPPS